LALGGVLIVLYAIGLVAQGWSLYAERERMLVGVEVERKWAETVNECGWVYWDCFRRVALISLLVTGVFRIPLAINFILLV
jgi:hypothetical protein